MSLVTIQYPTFEVTKFFVAENGEEMLVGRLLVAVTPDQEQKYANLVDKGHLRFINWANPDRVDQE